MYIKKKVLTALLFAVTLLFSFTTNAQCAMCRAALESEEGGVKAEAVNDGIVYLMVIPYVLVGALGYAIYRLKTKKKEK
ncbi:hypothetical protein [Flavobacterium cerinum]|uniref:Adenylosuccinate synthetase n=1 Tax=Flavobacterium cerinum TaxID=2502784 RepID=A0ABY5IWP3_9FLAO|nr:hypothetical protein [Flavobacterium cerinum]UUC46700.1 hypothetical protein NOX80_05745 [Flavobacterium cerinum]